MKFEERLQLLLEDHSYSCVMIHFPKEIADRIKKWGKKHIKDEDIYEDPKDDSFGREDETHVTVKYGFYDEKPDKVQEVIGGSGKVPIKLGKVSKFSTDDYDVIKIDVNSRRLHTLHNKMKKEIRNKEDYNDYKPHVTIAYVLPGTADGLLGSDEFADVEFEADAATFSSKDGSKHQVSLASGKI